MSIVTPDQDLAPLATASADTIRRLQDQSGAYPASPSFSAYLGYCWFRDGAFIADAMSAYGDTDSAERFFDWCARVLIARAEQIATIVAAEKSSTPLPDTAMLPTRFTFDGGEGKMGWEDFQLDGYGTWAWAAVQHAERHGTSLDRWAEALRLTADYLSACWSRPCYDWWEEHSEQVHVSTLGCVAAGLQALASVSVLDADQTIAARQAAAGAITLLQTQGVSDGHLTKWIDSSEVDGSLAALVSPLRVVAPGSELARETLAAIDADLNAEGGVHRFRFDTFYGGGQWPLLSCFLGLARAASGDRSAALDQLRWAASTVDGTDIPEQVDRHLLAPERKQEWVQRWGPVANPLLWSSAMYLRLALELGVIAPRERTGR